MHISKKIRVKKQINSINKLNGYAKNLIKQEKIKIEQAYHLSRLSGKRQQM